MRTLEQYLRDEISKGNIDFSVRATMSHPKGTNVDFYIHPTGKDGDTAEFRIYENSLVARQDSGAKSP